MLTFIFKHTYIHAQTHALCHAASSFPAHSSRPELRGGGQTMSSLKTPRWLRGEEGVTENQWIYETSREFCLFKEHLFF